MLVEGVGINDADYTVKTQTEHPKVDGKRVRKLDWVCPFYQTWKNMLSRCYNAKYQKTYGTYVGCSVCDEWLLFSNFKSWMEQQEWEGKALDKDLLVYQNKIYSPETCVFLDLRINNFLVKCDKRRGKTPLGVSKNRTRYTASCWKDNSKTQYEGSYATAELAHKAWQRAKIRLAKELLETVDVKIGLGIQRIIDKIQYDLDNNLITEDF